MAREPGSRGPRSRARRKRVALAIWAGVGTFAVLLVLDGIWAGTRLVRGLSRARSELAVGIESVVTGDPDAAEPHFVAAAAAAEQARGAVGHPSLGLAGLLPLVGDNVAAAAAVADASHATAGAGLTMVAVARDLGWSDIGIPASTSAGDLDVAAYEAATPQMASVAAQLARALGDLEASGGGRLVGPVASGYRDALHGLTRRADLAARFRDTMRLVATLFAGDEPRRYLVSAPTLGIPRPDGGAPAAVGLLTARDGVLELGRLGPAPPAFADVTSSPDWPTTARAMAAAARTAGFPRLDGVILLDAIALQDLVWVTGDVTVDRRTRPLTDATTAAALEIDAFLGSLPAKAARLHATWASDVVLAFLEHRPAVESLALAMAADARDRHLAIFLVDRVEQRLVNALGLDGRVRLGVPGILPVAATWSAGGPDHVGAVVETSIRHTVAVREDGSAAVETEVLFENAAGTDPPSVFLGRGTGGVPVGTFTADVTVALPRKARDVVAETSRPSPIATGRTLGAPTVTGSLAVRGGASTTFTVTYVVDGLVRRIGGLNEFVVRLLPQPTVTGVRYQVRIELPDGSRIESASRELERRGTAAVFSGTRAGELDLELRYR